MNTLHNRLDEQKKPSRKAFIFSSDIERVCIDLWVGGEGYCGFLGSTFSSSLSLFPCMPSCLWAGECERSGGNVRGVWGGREWRAEKREKSKVRRERGRSTFFFCPLVGSFFFFLPLLLFFSPPDPFFLFGLAIKAAMLTIVNVVILSCEKERREESEWERSTVAATKNWKKKGKREASCGCWSLFTSLPSFLICTTNPASLFHGAYGEKEKEERKK